MDAVQEFNAASGAWETLPDDPAVESPVPADTPADELDETPVPDGKATNAAERQAKADAHAAPDPRPEWEQEARRPTNAEARKDPKARIAQQTWDQREAQRRAEAVERENARLRQELEAAKRGPAKADQPAQPAPETFPPFATYLESHPEATLEQWLDARDTWRDTQRDAARKAEADEQRIESTFTEQATKFGEAFSTAVRADPDLERRIDPALMGVRPYALLTAKDKQVIRNIADPRERELVAFRCFLADQWLGATNPIALLEHLSDPKTFQRLATLPPAHVVRELAILDARSGAAPAASAPSRKPVSSQAPAPIQPLGSSPHVPDDSPSDDDSDDDWLKKEQARERQRRAR